MAISGRKFIRTGASGRDQRKNSRHQFPLDSSRLSLNKRATSLSHASLCTRKSFTPFSRAALILGHPGHELKVLGWLSEYAPFVYVVTDGGGRRGASRVPSTAALVTEFGGQLGDVFGCISDAGIYQAILDKDIPFFLGLVDRIAASLIEHGIDFVAGDAAEGFNPTHDICRAVINAAVNMARAAASRRIANYEFLLTEWEQRGPEEHNHRCVHLHLDDSLLCRKLLAAERYVELREEVHRALAQRGREYFRVECLRQTTEPGTPPQDSPKPYYETWGEKRISEGKYAAVIRFREHILPITDEVFRYAFQTRLERPYRSAQPNSAPMVSEYN